MSIAWRETKRYFRSPSSYIILALFLVYQGLIFYIAVRYLNDPRAPHGAPMKFFFGGPFWFWPLECFIIAIITMDTLAHEQIRRTVEPMLTAPVHESELVLGKFLGALGFFFFLWVWTFFYVIIMVCHTKGVEKSTILQLGLTGGFGGLWAVLLVATRRGAPSGVIAWVTTALAGLVAAGMHPGLGYLEILKLLGLTALPVLATVGLQIAPRSMATARFALYVVLIAGIALVAVQGVGYVAKLFSQAGENAPNLGPILSGYIGALLIGAAGIALGILYSSLTRDLKLACMLTFVSLFLLIIVKIMLLPELNLIETEWVRELMRHLNFFDYMHDFSRGIVDTRQVTLLGSIVLFCLFGASRALQVFKWR
jgi:ABC-type transport system involved in multi-copper enzyme maturation permease subunit